MAWFARTEEISPVITQRKSLTRFCSRVEERALAEAEQEAALDAHKDARQ